MTDLEVRQSNGVDQGQTWLAMSPEQAKALDEQVRRCTEAVLQEGTDYGIIPGTNGEKTLWRPGAQKLLQWFRLGYTCDRVDIERDEQGRKHGITYRAEVRRRHPDGTYETLATCEGTADYDEAKFYQSAEERQRQVKERETRNAEKYKRPRNPEKWKDLPEYRADWNALMKRAQKRAIVGAVVDATAAGGIFADREEDENIQSAPDEGTSFYDEAIDRALKSDETEQGGELQALFVGAAEAHKRGLISRRQQDHIQNTVRQRLELLKKRVVVEVEDLADKAAAERSQAAAEDSQDGADPLGLDGGREVESASGEMHVEPLPVEDPPDWPEVTRPGTGKPKGK